MRSPAALGFYPPDKNELENLIKKLFSDIKTQKEKVKGAVVPHAGYVYSGKTAAYVYGSLQRYDSVIIVAPNHSGVGEEIAISTDDWETPLGVVKNDVSLGKKLIEKCNLIKEDELAHMYEHSIEVQLPFLQTVLKDFKFVPISLSSRFSGLETCEILGEAIRDVIESKNILVLGSSDFTHFGKSYGFAPVSKNELEWIKKTDKKVIDSILKNNIGEMFKLATKTTVCGYAPIAVVMSALKGKARLLNYSTSYDVSKNKEMIVGYAGIVFEK